jgi:hypothetical protein
MGRVVSVKSGVYYPDLAACLGGASTRTSDVLCIAAGEYRISPIQFYWRCDVMSSPGSTAGSLTEDSCMRTGQKVGWHGPAVMSPISSFPTILLPKPGYPQSTSLSLVTSHLFQPCYIVIHSSSLRENNNVRF